MARVNSSLGLEILGDHLVEGDAEPGSYAVFSPDLIMGHDVTTPPAANMINQAGLVHLRAAGRTTLYLDHFTPPKDRKSAEACRLLREFSARYGIEELVDWGEGICHVHMFEDNKVLPKQLVVGADSHITTGGALGALCIGIGSTDLAVAIASGELWLQVPEPYGIELHGTPDVWCEGKDIALRMISWLGAGGGRGRILEMDGEMIKWLGDDGRFTITNLAAETSCDSALLTTDFPENGPLSPDWSFHTETVDIDGMGPQVAVPDRPNNVEPVENVTGEVIDQVFIGSCTNGRLDDMRQAAQVLKGRKVHRDVRLLVIPGSRKVYSLADRAGYLKTMIDAGGMVSMPTCGPCAGGFLGILPDGEKALATTNRNFKGRMGEPSSKVYISGSAVAAASAVRGMIVHPEEVSD